ncbi:hypothetical protein SAMN06269301_0317 [Geobacter sp. DSM 9736]|nr:hypothetical protein SAMN06269301_0317 [Geobacter sp. DSM 9736]
MTANGEALVCVRYRYDANKRKQYQTIEIIVSESDWILPPPKYPDSKLVGLKIGVKETNLQSQVKANGGRWDKDKKVWVIPYGCIRGTTLEKFIVIEMSSVG